MEPAALRILDANFNRAREGLRVLEEHARFVLDDSGLTGRLKSLRHELTELACILAGSAAMASRDTAGDVGTGISTDSEAVRVSTAEVAAAAAGRLSESLRCIEEYGKLVDTAAAREVEQLRYRLYSIEQDLLIAAPKRKRLRHAALHVLITESLARGDWYAVCEAALAGGADVIQLREKELPDRELLGRARRLRELTRARGALCFVNDRPDIARLADADGVHVGQSDLSVADVRRIAGPTILVGKSTHTPEEVAAALEESPDYLGVGPMFASPTKPEVRIQGVALLAHAAGATDLPLVAIGGINPANAGDLSARPPFAVAVCQSVIAAADPTGAAYAIRERTVFLRGSVRAEPRVAVPIDIF